MELQEKNDHFKGSPPARMIYQNSILRGPLKQQSYIARVPALDLCDQYCFLQATVKTSRGLGGPMQSLINLVDVIRGRVSQAVKGARDYTKVTSLIR